MMMILKVLRFRMDWSNVAELELSRMIEAIWSVNYRDYYCSAKMYQPYRYLLSSLT